MNKFEKIIDNSLDVISAIIAFLLTAIVVVLHVIFKCALPIGVIVLALCVARYFGII